MRVGEWLAARVRNQANFERPKMRRPLSVRRLEDFGRIRLSRSFFMRDFLFTEIGAIEGMQNIPDDPVLAVAAGRVLCETLLEPLQATFGRIALRSGYRAPEINQFGNSHGLSCASNINDYGRHIWDRRDERGALGAMATVVVPWLIDRRRKGMNWPSLAWWIHDNLPYSELQFFPKLAAFNISWSELPRRRIWSFVPPRGLLTKPGMPGHEGDHSHLYPGFPSIAPTEPLALEELGVAIVARPISTEQRT